MTNQTPDTTHAAPRNLWTHKALWLIGIGLLANAGIMLFHRSGPADLLLDRSAFAQVSPAPQLLGARGIYMMPAQLGPQTFGLYLMDVDSETITVYRANPDQNRFKLMAARSFKNDRFLTDYNNDKPTPAEITKLVNDQRNRKEIVNKNDEATVNQNPPPDENKPDAPKPDAPKQP